MKRALIFVVLVAATACTSMERETLMVAHGVPVRVAASSERTCVEVDEAARGGRWCAPDDRPQAVWLGTASVGDGLVVVGQAPADVESVALAGKGGLMELAVEQLESGRFFVGWDVPPGDYEVTAERADGNEYVSGDVLMRGGGTTLTTFTP